MTSIRSDEQLIQEQGVERVPDLVHQVRGLSFFSRHASRGMTSIAGRDGLALTLNRPKLARAFVDWVADLNSQKAASEADRRDYIIFSAGLLLRRLLDGGILQATSPGHPADHRSADHNGAPDPAADDFAAGDGGKETALAMFWPEGYIATSYCLTVLDTVLRQEGLPPVHLQPVASDIRTWWSFRENVADDPRLAIPFLDLMVGSQPNWTHPVAASERAAIRTPGAADSHASPKIERANIA